MFSKFAVPDVEEEEEVEEDIEENVEEIDLEVHEQQLSLEQLQNVMCVICLEKLKDCLLQPCFHWVICQLCATELRAQTPEGENPKCPACSERFIGIIQPRNALN
jgi:hypothetical protein